MYKILQASKFLCSGAAFLSRFLFVNFSVYKFDYDVLFLGFLLIVICRFLIINMNFIPFGRFFSFFAAF